MKLSANSAELKRGIDESNRELRRLRETSDNVGRNIVTAFAKVTAAFVAVRGSVNQVRDVMNSTMTTADALRRTTDGLTGAMGAFNRALASGDFTSFINNIQNAYRAAADFSDILDELAKKQLSLSLQDVSVAAEVFRLDQIIYADDATKDQVQQALADKERLYRVHYDQVLSDARIHQDEMQKMMALTFGVDADRSSEVYGYFTNYHLFDEERAAAEQYFEMMTRIRNLDEGRSRTQAFAAPGGGPASLAQRPDMGTGDEIARLRAEAEQYMGTLEGMALWIVQNESLINFVDPIKEQIIQAEMQILRAESSLEQRMAGITRERRRMGNRFGAVSEAPSPIEDIAGPGLGAPLLPDFVETQIRIALDQGDYQNAILSLNALQEELARLTDIRLNISPSDEDYAELNIAMQQLQDRITQITTIGLGEEIADEFEIVEEKIEELTRSLINWEGVAIGATQAVVSAFMDMAMGIEVSIKSILESLARMIMMQLVSAAVSSMFAPASVLGGGSSFIPNAQALSGGLNLQIPSLGAGGFSGGRGGGFGGGINPNMDVNVTGQISGQNILIAGDRAARRRLIIEP